MRNNLILNSDSYKTSHWLQLPELTDGMYSYGEARGSDHGYTEVVQWGMTAIIKKYFLKPITAADVAQAGRFVDRHMGPGVFNYDGWNYIVEKHNGYLPLRIRALPEGTVVPLKNVMFAVKETDPKCAWLVSYFEPILLQLWYPSTVATISFSMRKMIEEYFEKSVDTRDAGSIAFKVHDFGFRGAAVPEAAEIATAGHLLSFAGTDSMRGIAALYDFYGLDEEDDNSMPAFSVIASEHSTMCANSDADRRDDEPALEMLVRLMETQGGIISGVADTYDVFNYVELVCTKYRDRIMAADGVFVVRPDSGDATVIPVLLIERLLKGFGYRVNDKGFKVLPDCIRVLQGDGVNEKSMRIILDKLMDLKISADNIIFGIGGALVQHCDRDWLKWAMKGSSISVDGKQRDLYKDPITDSVKRSKKGRVTTFKDSQGQYFSDRIELAEVNKNIVDQLVTVFENGQLIFEEPFPTIRARVEKHFNK